MTYRIYVACLASYNAGILFGEWLDVEGKCGEDLREEITELLKKSPIQEAEEWAIHDTEGFGSYEVSEWHDLEELCEHVEAITSSDYDTELIEAVCEDRNINAREAIEHLNDNYQGDYDSFSDWAYSFLLECGDLEAIPESLRDYFDFDAYGRDEEINGTIATFEASGRRIYVLWNR